MSTWRTILPMLLDSLLTGSNRASAIARGEIKRMAEAADIATGEPYGYVYLDRYGYAKFSHERLSISDDDRSEFEVQEIPVYRGIDGPSLVPVSGKRSKE